jgi:hypothetical protein
MERTNRNHWLLWAGLGYGLYTVLVIVLGRDLHPQTLTLLTQGVWVFRPAVHSRHRSDEWTTALACLVVLRDLDSHAFRDSTGFSMCLFLSGCLKKRVR